MSMPESKLGHPPAGCLPLFVILSLLQKIWLNMLAGKMMFACSSHVLLPHQPIVVGHHSATLVPACHS